MSEGSSNTLMLMKRKGKLIDCTHNLSPHLLVYVCLISRLLIIKALYVVINLCFT